MKKIYREKVREELKMYNMSFKAFLLGYDSWYIGTYIRCKRQSLYYQHKSLIHKILWGGVISG